MGGLQGRATPLAGTYQEESLGELGPGNGGRGEGVLGTQSSPSKGNRAHDWLMAWQAQGSGIRELSPQSPWVVVGDAESQAKQLCSVDKHIVELGWEASRAYRKIDCDVFLRFLSSFITQQYWPQGGTEKALGVQSEDPSSSCGILRHVTWVLSPYSCAEG